MQDHRNIDPRTLANLKAASRELTLLTTSAAARHQRGYSLVTSGGIPDFYLLDHPFATVAFPLRGRSTVHARYQGKSFDYVVKPGGFSILPGGGEFGLTLSDPLECLSLPLWPNHVQETAEREGARHPSSVVLTPTWHRTDPDVVGLGQAFASFLRSPNSGSALYAESLWTQITLRILWNYSSLPPRRDPAVERLSNPRVRRVIDFMQTTLADDVSLSDLAAVAGLSPNYFLNAFRKATGKTPHRYRTELRVERAREMLRNPLIPIIQVALAVGYSSQSHLTTVFRRVLGVTPATYRTQILGLKESDAG